MSLTKAQLQAQTWRKDSFVISTKPGQIPVPRLMEVLDSDEIYWAKSLPAEAMQEMLDSSLCFGLFEEHDSNSPDNQKFIGIARCVTDFTTFAYLTDVWVDPSYQGKGLGTWMMRCANEVLEQMPHLRRTLLFTSDWSRSVPFYQKVMHMDVLEVKEGEGLAVMGRRMKGHTDFFDKAD